MRRTTVQTEPAATAIVLMVLVRVVCVPADNVRLVLTDNVQVVPTDNVQVVRMASVPTGRAFVETAQADVARSIKTRMFATIPARITEHRETGRLAQRGQILLIRFVGRNTRMTMTTGLSVPPCEIL